MADRAERLEHSREYEVEEDVLRGPPGQVPGRRPEGLDRERPPPQVHGETRWTQRQGP